MQNSELTVKVELESSHGSHSYANVTFGDISTDWRRYTATLTARATDSTARLAVKLQVLTPSISASAFLNFNVFAFTLLKVIGAALCGNVLPIRSASILRPAELDKCADRHGIAKLLDAKAFGEGLA